jgi:hypothetical protein
VSFPLRLPTVICGIYKMHRDVRDAIFSRSPIRLSENELASRVRGTLATVPRAKNFGGADRDRTDDLRLAKPALSQLSYSPLLSESLWWA